MFKIRKIEEGEHFKEWPSTPQSGPSEWIIHNENGYSLVAYPQKVAEHIANAMNTAGEQGYAKGYDDAQTSGAVDSAKAFAGLLYLLERNQWATAIRIIRERMEVRCPQFLPPLPHPTTKTGE